MYIWSVICIHCSIRDRGRTAEGTKKSTACPSHCIAPKHSHTLALLWAGETHNPSARTELAVTLWNIKGEKEVDHFWRRMPSFLDATVDYFGFRRQECPFNI